MRKIIIISILFFARIASAAVFINEIAWMGTAADPNGSYCEWIELTNTGSESVNLNGWTLSIGDTTKIFSAENGATLSIAPAPHNFYLIERLTPSACPDPVPGISADWSVPFGSISNSAATISLKDASGGVAPVDTVVGSDGWKIGGVVAGDNTTKETAQRGPNGWFTGTPTPRAANTGATSAPTQEASTNTTQINTSVSLSSFPVEPQIIADAGAATRTISTGAPITFTGRVFGLKKEPIENARLVWSFGDGGRGEGVGVTHTYYYPGDYIAVLDASSGYFSASDRVAVRVVAPFLTLRTGGDLMRSFVAIENRGSDEVDLSLWQIKGGDKTFVLPQNTILGARKTLTLASEVTGLSTPADSVASLHFPNGTRVEMQGDAPASASAPRQLLNVQSAPTVPATHAVASARTPVLPTRDQEATALDAVDVTVTSLSAQEGGSLWPWYIGAAFLGVLALLGIRFAKNGEAENSSPADNFEIIEDGGEKDDVF